MLCSGGTAAVRARPDSTARRPKAGQRRRQARLGDRVWRALPAPMRDWLGAEATPVFATLRQGPVLLLLLLTIPLLTVAYQLPRTHGIDVARTDNGLYLHGFLTEEQAGGTDFRWMGHDAALIIPAAAGNGAWDVALRVGSQRPAGLPSPALDIFADQRLVAHVETVPEFREYRFRVARPALAAEDLTIRLATTTFDPPGATDDRQLGLALSGATATPVREPSWRPLLPPPGYALQVLLLAGLLAGVMGRLGVPRRALVAVLGAAIAGIALWQALRPEYAVPFLRAMILVAAILVVTLLALRPLVRRLFAAGGVPLTAQHEQILLGIVLGGALFHLAGIVFPGFRPHDLGFHANRVNDIVNGRFLLISVVSEWGYRRTPYGPALYVLAAPIAALLGDTTWPLRFLVPVLDATSAILVCYLLRRCRFAEPAPLLGAAFTILVPASSQLLWWGFFSNLFGQWTTLVVLTIVIGHWDDLPKPAFLGTLVVFLSLTLLSHPGTFVLTVALLPPLAIILWLVRRDGRGSALALLGALALSGVVVYLLYYRFFTELLVDSIRSMFTGVAVLPAGADDERGWEPNYVRLRLFAFPFLLYVTTALIAGIRLARERSRLGWAILAILATGVCFGIVHLTAGIWVRYFIFVSPALAIAAAIAVAWLWGRGRLGRLLGAAALAYCTVASLAFWFSITVLGNRSPYP